MTFSMQPGPDGGELYREALERIDAGKYEEAVELLDTLAGPACRDGRIRYARAVALLSTGEYGRAGTDLVFTVVLERGFLPAYRDLGFVLLTMGREEAAAKVLNAAIEIDPHYVDAWAMLGDVHMDLGEPEKARESFEQARAIDPQNPEVHCKLAMFHLSRGNMKGLREEYEVLRELDPCMAAQIAELLL